MLRSIAAGEAMVAEWLAHFWWSVFICPLCGSVYVVSQTFGLYTCFCFGVVRFNCQENCTCPSEVYPYTMMVVQELKGEDWEHQMACCKGYSKCSCKCSTHKWQTLFHLSGYVNKQFSLLDRKQSLSASWKMEGTNIAKGPQLGALLLVFMAIFFRRKTKCLQ